MVTLLHAPLQYSAASKVQLYSLEPLPFPRIGAELFPGIHVKPFMKIACPTAALCSLVLCLHAADTKPYHESLTPRLLSEWKDSGDGKVRVCFVVDKTTFAAKETIVVRCALRNHTDKPLTILRPFGDPFYAHSAGIAILGPDGPITYKGPMKDYILGAASFVELPSHSVVEETLDLPKDCFPGLGKPGLYAIHYRFVSSGHPGQPAPENFWQGQIKTPSLTLLVK